MKSDILERKDHPSVIQYLNQLQAAVTRLSGHGAQCKIWAVGLVCSVAVVIKGLGTHEMSRAAETGLCVVPFVMLFLLNAYYYGLEKQILEWRTLFVKKLEDPVDEVFPEDIYFDPIAGGLKFADFCKALVSPSVAPFYLCFITALLFVQTL